jgi:hypothetical protein
MSFLMKNYSSQREVHDKVRDDYDLNRILD